MVALLLLACQGDPSAAEVPITDPRPYVDPRIATGGPGFRVGSATPAATVPFGMVKLGPDTTSENGALPAYHCSGYYYDDDWIEGFSHLHMHGVGVPDLGTVLVMPTDGWTDDKREETGYRQPFDHADEAAEPGLYTVTLADGIRAELSATMHVGHHRYTFPADMAPTLVFDLEHNLDVRNSGGEIHVDADAGVVEGWTLNTGAFSGGSSAFPVYFHAVVDGGFTTFGTWADDEAHEGRTEAAGVDLGAWVRPGANPVSVRVGVSVVSLDNARANLAW